MKQLADAPHRRYNILTGEWVLVSPHRAKRPWQGQVEKPAVNERPVYDEKCYLCPGNERAGGYTNPEYDSVFVFTNDFSSLLPEGDPASLNIDNLLIAKSEKGLCRVVCFSPKHNLTLPEMDLPQIRNVIDVWTSEYEELGKKDFINYVQIFENKGEVMGCSNPHPHGQIWAQSSIPGGPAKEDAQMQKYYKEHGESILSAYLRKELQLKERIIAENDGFAALVPFWAVWPFEAMIISKRHFGSLPEMTDSEKDSFADILKKLTIKYDNLFNISFPYSSGIHQAPTDGIKREWLHFHMHFYPPLLRSAAVKKFMVGYEMLAEPQRDITPELSAQKLRELPDIHFKLQA